MYIYTYIYFTTKARFTLIMQEQFNIRKSIRVIYLINRLKEENKHVKNVEKIIKVSMIVKKKKKPCRKLATEEDFFILSYTVNNI